MKVDVTVGRLDLVRFNISTLFKIRANWVMFLLAWAFVFVIVVANTEGDFLGLNIGYLILTTLLMSVCWFIVFYMLLMLWTIIVIGRKSGWIGPKTFSIEDAGLRESTESGETLQKWSSIKNIMISGRMMLIQRNQIEFFLIPEKGFDDQSQFEPFSALVMERWKAAA